MTDTDANRRACMKQIARLGAIQPMNDAKCAGLLDVAVGRFPDAVSVRSAVDGLLEDPLITEVPTPAAFGQLAPARERRIGCEKCDEGWIQVTRRQAAYDGMGYVTYEAVTRCECRKVTA
jgi:hypothetical protein